MVRRDNFYFRVFCITFWVMATFHFIIEDFIPIIKVYTPILLLSDAIFVALGLATLQKKSDKILIISFFFIAAISSLVNKIPLILFLNGLRDYIGWLFILPILRYFFTCANADKFRQSLDFQFKVFLCIQPFCILIQFIQYGAGDYVGGSLGHWNSGIISTLIIYLSFYFVSKNWDEDNFLKSLWNNKLYIFLIFPVFLNETKVSFIFLFIYFILLCPFKAGSFIKLIIVLPFLVIFMAGTYFFYDWAVGGSEMLNEGFLEEYVTGADNIDNIMNMADEIVDNELGERFTAEELLEVEFPDIPRFAKIAFMIPALQDTNGDFILGAGIGHLKGGTALDYTEFTKKHMSLFIGTTMMAHMFFLSLGIIGMIWFIIWIKQLLVFKIRANRLAFKIKLFILFLFIISFVYNDGFRLLIPCIVIYYISLTTIYPLLPVKNKDNA